MFSRPSQCCYVRQNTLLTHCASKVSAFDFNARKKTCAPLSDCCINNALIHFVPSCQDTCTQLVDVLDPLLVDLILHYGPHFMVDGFKSGVYGGQSVGGMNSGDSTVSSSIALWAGALSC